MNLNEPHKGEWPLRYKEISKFVKPKSSIIDLGCGRQLLLPYFKNPTLYVGLDKLKTTPTTVVVNFDNDELPDHPDYPDKFDYVVCSGILEYLKNIDKFLVNIHKYSNQVIFSYYHKPKKLDIWNNCLTKSAFKQLLMRCGWKIVKESECQSNHFIYYCNEKRIILRR